MSFCRILAVNLLSVIQQQPDGVISPKPPVQSLSWKWRTSTESDPSWNKWGKSGGRVITNQLANTSSFYKEWLIYVSPALPRAAFSGYQYKSCWNNCWFNLATPVKHRRWKQHPPLINRWNWGTGYIQTQTTWKHGIKPGTEPSSLLSICYFVRWK